MGYCGHWHRVDLEGNPTEKGDYDVILIYDEIKATESTETGLYTELMPTGRKLAFQDTRYFGDAELSKGWVMKGQPDHGNVWIEESGSRYNERVYAWFDKREFPDAPGLPDGVEWEDE